MKNRYTILVLALLMFGLIFGLNGCSDNSSTGSDDGADCSSISLPSELVQAQITLEYFQSNSFSGEEYSTYNLVKQQAIGGSSSLSAGISAASGYLALAQGFPVEPEANNGACQWTFDASPFTGGQELMIQVNANPVSDGLEWEVIIDGNFEDENVDNFKYIDGFVSTDGQSGNWNGYSPEDPNTPVFTYTWDIESEENYELTYDAGTTTIDYLRNGADSNEMTYNQNGEITDLFWNENNDTGWIELPEEDRMCYTDFENSACS